MEHPPAETFAAAAPVVLDPQAAAIYRNVLSALAAEGVPFLVGGAYAFARYTGIERHTKDLDLFVRRADYGQLARVLGDAGYATELVYPHWLGKARAGEVFVDLIFNSANGLTEVDEDWFAHAVEAEVLGVPARLVPPEEMLWSKAFIMERERYDGADVAHLLHACAATLDWPRLLARFGAHWRVLLSHLVLFGFIYPDERERVPQEMLERLLERLRDETQAPPPADGLCQGTLLSRAQYLHDVEREGYGDGREAPHGPMSAQDIAAWTDAIPDRQPPAPPPA
ncbi:nucleotidyltransferase [Caldimonas tepidiphila]|uniref:nucleotidyltransferase n=1 Tax=Caldimonas tepidiphila TaxID=2315841 RepID=UPI000E5C1A3C|nr:nucleotidyltransferase [Caldimonas tepidiphila]